MTEPLYCTLELNDEARRLLNNLAFLGGRTLYPFENRIGQRLESMGLCRLTMVYVEGGGLLAGGILSHAIITGAGRRAARNGPGVGPVLVCVDGVRLEERPETGTYYTPAAVVDRIVQASTGPED